MNCLFCQQEMNDFAESMMDSRVLDTKYVCCNMDCWVDRDFPRYVCFVNNGDATPYYQEYALGNFYVKTGRLVASIFRLEHSCLFDEVRILRPLPLNAINSAETLDKLKMMAMLS